MGIPDRRRKLASLLEHRELLRWHYIRNANQQLICRRLGIRPRPTSIFDIELSRAEAELARVLAEQANPAFAADFVRAREAA